MTMSTIWSNNQWALTRYCCHSRITSRASRPMLALSNKSYFSAIKTHKHEILKIDDLSWSWTISLNLFNLLQETSYFIFTWFCFGLFSYHSEPFEDQVLVCLHQAVVPKEQSMCFRYLLKPSNGQLHDLLKVAFPCFDPVRVCIHGFVAGEEKFAWSGGIGVWSSIQCRHLERLQQF